MKQKRASVAHAGDPRLARSDEQIGGALLQLLARRRYDRIRVGDITREARVSRATFYRHHRTKDALLAARFSKVLEVTIGRGEPKRADLTRFFAHAQQVPFVWRSLMTGGARQRAEPVLRRCLEAQFLPAGADDQSAQLYARIAAATVLTLLAWRFESDRRVAPAAMQGLYAAVLAGGHAALAAELTG
jgi:AcrR family transcriptional regulator